MAPVASFDPSRPFTAIDAAIAGSTPANPSAIDLAVAPAIPAAAPAPPKAPVFDPSAPFTAVPEAPSPVTGGPAFDASKEFQKSFGPEEVKSMPVEALDLEKDFNPVAFGFEHEAALNADPVLKQKVLDTYKLREATGRTTADQLKKFAESPTKIITTPLKATFEVGKMLLGGAGQVLKNVSDAGIGGAARLLGAASVGGKAGEAGLNEEGKRIERAQAEVIAAPEAAATGTADLLRRGVRTAVETAAKLDPTGFVQDVTGEKPFSELTNDEVAARFSNDVAGKKAIAEAGRGAGEMMKAIGLHADELKQAGIELRPGVIEAMSPVLDITNLVPLGAGAKVGMITKTGGRYAVRELATAATKTQASSFIEAINKGAQTVGTGVEKAGDLVDKYALSHKGLGMQTAALSAVVGPGGLAGGAKIFAAAKLTGPALVTAGRLIKVAAPAAIDTAVEFTKGYGQGLLFTAPFMIGADAEEREGLLGAAGLGGVARGGVRGFKHVGEAAQDRLAGTIFKAVDQSEPPKGSFDHYGTDPRLDTDSAAQIAKLDLDPVRARAARIAQLEKAFDAETVRLDAQSGLTPRQYEKRLKERAERIAKVPEVVKVQQNLFGWVRHIFKDSGVEFYATDDAGMMRQTGGQSGRGYTVKTGQTLAADGAVKPLIRVFLNGDVESLPHEMLHALGELDAPRYTEFKNEVNATLTPDQRKSFEQIYNTVYNEREPEAKWTKRLTPEQVTNEIAAELFSRTVLGEDLSGVPQPLRETTAIVASALLEILGIPLGKLSRAQAKDFVPKGTKIKAGFSTLGLRPGTAAQAHGQNFIQGLLKQAKEGGLTAPAEVSAVAGGTLVPGEISRKPKAPPSTPGAPPTGPVTPIPPITPITPITPTTPAGPRNIRTTEAAQGDFAAQRAEEMGIDKAREFAKTGPPEVAARIEEIIKLAERENPALEIAHEGVIDTGTAAAPTGETARDAAQQAAYEKERAIALGAMPEKLREEHQKIFKFDRFEISDGGKLYLEAKSLDKVITNAHRIIKRIEETKNPEIERLNPYESQSGKLTEAGWENLVKDIQDYTENQANGFRGDGQKLVRPENAKELGIFIPEEKPGYVTTPIEDPPGQPKRADFLNLVMGLKDPPLTNRIQKKGEIPANLKGLKIAEINLRPVETPSVILEKHLLKQKFPAKVTEPIFPGRGPIDIGEVNPLRNQLRKAGVDVRDLYPVTERINVENIKKVTPRPDINLKAPVTDTIRGGFLPGGPEFFNQNAVADIGRAVLDSPTPESWQKLANDMGGLTGAAYRLGASLKDVADVAKLREFQAEAKAKYNTAKSVSPEAMDFDAIMSAASKTQFFNEALETATGVSPAKHELIGRSYLGADWKPPFPEEAKGQLLPAKKKQTAEERIAATDYSKYDTAPSTGTPRLTGWILPNRKYVPMDVSFHEQFLADQADDLNKRFGTNFSKTPNVEDRLVALNKGFVRIRGGLQGGQRTSGAGGVVVEMNEKFFPKVRGTLESYLVDNADSIDNLTVNLLNDKGNVKDYQRAVVHELDGAEKANALLAVLDDLRLRGPEGQALPGGDKVALGAIKKLNSATGSIKPRTVRLPVRLTDDELKALRRFVSKSAVEIDKALTRPPNK